ncbi:hypothetical protein SFRURICE_011121 [Spodoptera frugiperda]|nr:hypothetical protein SFRURICE_011121 [Spodoptera frugiperda]
MSILSPPKIKLGRHVSHSGVEDKDWVSERDCVREAGVAARRGPALPATRQSRPQPGTSCFVFQICLVCHRQDRFVREQKRYSCNKI